MIKLEASFVIITPLFMSGADRKMAELRAGSIRGVLRFWWRALALGHYESWEEVRKAEFALFGSSSGGQSRVHISISAPEESLNRRRSGEQLMDRSGKILDYGGRYLGYGVVDISGHASRPYLDAPLKFDVKIHLRPQCRKSPENLSEEADLLEGALKAMGLVGGIGSRSRRGFGSVTLLGLKRDGVLTYEAPKNAGSYLACLREFVKKYIRNVTGLPEYTSFSQDTRVYLLKIGTDPLQLLDEIGQAMQMYRSWGLNGMVNGTKRSEKIFKDDHDNMRAALSGSAKDHPRRVAFGLPHNYFFSSMQRKLTVLAEDHERRASPLFIHIHMLSDNEYAAVVSIFPARFLPDNEEILIQPDYGDDQSKTLQSNWLDTLIDFVEGIVHDGTGKKRFPDLEVIQFGAVMGGVV